MAYARLHTTAHRFYGVETLGISLSHGTTYDPDTATVVAVSSSVYGYGDGLIADSGTTDIYLPKAIASAWNSAWRAVYFAARIFLR